jgi:hypothetical protein
VLYSNLFLASAIEVGDPNQDPPNWPRRALDWRGPSVA